MRAIILAAGRDSIAGYPACLVPFGDRSSLERQIEIFSQVGVDDVTVVVGRDTLCWRQVYIDQVLAMPVKVVENPNNDQRGNAESLRMALHEGTNEFLLISDGDTVFDREILSHLINNRHDNLMLIRPTSHIADSGTRIVLDGEQIILIGKDKYKENSTWEMYGGLIKLSASAQTLLFDELSRGSETDEYFTAALNDLVTNAEVTFILHGYSPSRGGASSFLKGGSYAGIRKFTMVRKETTEWKEKLVDEIHWLKKLPPEISNYFSRVVNHGISKSSAYYEMMYYPFPSLREMIFDGSIDSSHVCDLLMEITRFLFDNVYSRNQVVSPEDYCTRVHLNRIEDRLRETRQKSDVIKRIIEAPYIRINGQEYHNMKELCARLRECHELFSVLRPPQVSMVHGDLHFDNILINRADENLPPFIFVDPRGLDRTYNYTYDLAKLWHSFHGLYDLIHEDLFELSFRFESKFVDSSFQFKLYPVLDLYRDIHKGYIKNLRESGLMQGDPYWEIRILFAEAAHFCSVMPFHLCYDEEESKAVALYLTGVMQLSRILELYEQSVTDENFDEKSFLSRVSDEIQRPRGDEVYV